MSISSPILVTGASGFVASHLVQQLLEKGYRVRGTVRSLSNEEKYKHLLDLDPSKEKLELVEANLTEEGSFDEAVKGCEYVMHTASPYVLNVKDPQKDLVDPAVKGTKNVLESCSKSGTVKKVILTSSVAAITDSPKEGYVYTEKDWNEESSLKRNPYYYSKKLAEQAAWDYVKEDNKFKLIVINPFLVIGPEKSKSVNTSNQIFKDIVTGKYPGIMDFGWGMVDVRDVAKAHILALENEEAEGRYICWNTTLSMKETCQILKEEFPEFTKNIPSKNFACSAGNVLVKLGSYFQDSGTGQYIRTNLGKHPKLDNSKVKGLGLEFIPIRESIVDTVKSLKERNLI